MTFALIDHKPLSYNGYVYPEWAEWLGWTLAFSSILMIPGMAIVQMCRASGSFKKVKFISYKYACYMTMFNCCIHKLKLLHCCGLIQRLAYNITPLNERESMEKNKGECTRFRLKHWLYI